MRYLPEMGEGSRRPNKLRAHLVEVYSVILIVDIAAYTVTVFVL